ncbi:MAG: hypothetical protein ACK4K7_13055 [Allosphingosinicella sp.]|uniref:hypothetical protein n=1 Tax=Allosphingosinicella sp. TaxID=2823234 RepID=UPI0039395A3B
MLRRLPLAFAVAGFLAALLLLGPIGVAVGVLRSSSDAHGPSLGAQLLIAAIVIGFCALAGGLSWLLGRLVLRLFGRR